MIAIVQRITVQDIASDLEQDAYRLAERRIQLRGLGHEGYATRIEHARRIIDALLNDMRDEHGSCPPTVGWED